MPSYLQVDNLPPNFSTLFTIGYSVFYILLEPVAGSIIAPLLIAQTAFWNHLTSVMPTPTYQIAAGVFLFSWIIQFIGHGKFEGRAPALLDNLVQALVLAPFFVWMEVLFKLGYRPELRKRVDLAVEKELKKFHAANPNGGVKDETTK